MGKAIVYSAYLAALHGCTQDVSASTSGELAPVDQPLTQAIDVTALWTTMGNIVPVCWATAGFANEKGIIQNAVNNAWAAVTRVRFTGWKDCPTTGSTKYVRVQITPNGNGGSTNLPLGTGTLRGPTEGVSVDVDVFDGIAQSRLEYLGVHEFGHVLGFAHEMHRDDNPRTPGTCDALYGNAPGIKLTGAYDHDSVMNYCNSSGNNSGALTPLDIAGAQRVYGRAIPRIGVFNNGGWALDTDGNGQFNPGDVTYQNFGTAGDLPFIQRSLDSSSYWVAAIGTLRSGTWFVDKSLDGSWGSGDVTFSYGGGSDRPVLGNWSASCSADCIGVFNRGRWALDANADNVFASGDYTTTFGSATDLPVVGTWAVDSAPLKQIGVFNAGQWALDTNANRVFDAGDTTYGNFGTAGDLPIIADWNHDGRDKIGVFRNGEWFLDYNGNGVWDGESVDRYFRFGGPGDMPVVF